MLGVERLRAGVMWLMFLTFLSGVTEKIVGESLQGFKKTPIADTKSVSSRLAAHEHSILSQALQKDVFPKPRALRPRSTFRR